MMRQLTLAVVLLAAATVSARARELRTVPAEQDLTVVEFVATQERPRPERRWSLVPSAGIGFPEMDEINDYADWIEDSFGGSVDDVDLYRQYGVALEYRLSERWHAGLAYHRMEAETDGSYPWMATTRDFSIDVDVEGAELYVRRTWPRALGPLELQALAGAGYYGSHYTEEEDGYHVSGHDDTLGLRAGLGVGWDITDSLNLTLEGDYRLLKFESYKDSGRTVRFVSPGSPRAEADFTGFSVRASLSWRF